MTETFIQRPTPEPIKAFQVVIDAGDVREVLAAFGLSVEDDWTLSNRGGKYRLSFSSPNKSTSSVSVDSVAYTINLIGMSTGESTGQTVVNEGDWIVTKYYDTDYPEVSVVNDVEFQRQYKPDWFLSNTVNNYT